MERKVKTKPPPSMPMLNDDMLVHIFGYLNIYHLYTVSRCSRRFHTLAKSAFQQSFKGHFRWHRKSPTAASALRVFGRNVKHFKADEHLNTTNPWPLLSYTHLESLKINAGDNRLPSLMATLQAECDRGPFMALKSLDLYYDSCHGGEYDEVHIDFGRWFPNLEKFHLERGHFLSFDRHLLPRTLKTLSFDPFKVNQPYDMLLQINPDLEDLRVHSRVNLFNLLECLIANGQHRKMRKLQFHDSVHDHKHSMQLAFALGRFRRLERLKIEYKFCRSLAGLAEVLSRLKTLKALDISMTHRTRLETKLFLAALATNPPPKLELFRSGLSRSDISDQAWATFVANMPTTCKCVRYVAEIANCEEWKSDGDDDFTVYD